LAYFSARSVKKVEEEDCWDQKITIYTYVHVKCGMAHKTLTISEEAYDALARVKGKDESFTKVILRLTGRKTKGNLLEYLRSIGPDYELADRLEKIVEERHKIRLGSPRR